MADPIPVLITHRPVRAPNGTELVPNQRPAEATAQASTIDSMHDYRWHEANRAPLPSDNTAAGRKNNSFWKDTSTTPASVYVKTGEAGGVAQWAPLGVAEAAAAQALLETGGPSVLAMGAVPDGTFLRRVGSAVVGVASVGTVVESVTSNRILSAADHGKVLLVSGNVTITLPDSLGQPVTVWVLNIGGGTVSFETGGATLSPAGLTLPAGAMALLATLDGEEWHGLTAGGGAGQEKVLMLAVSDEASELEALPTRLSLRLPYALTVTGARANVVQAPEGAPLIVDVNAGGGTIFNTKLRIEPDELSSVTSPTQPEIAVASLADDTLITVDIDQVGSDYPGRGLKVTLYGYGS